jgi:16S rRNA (guanine(966)-N(2))-methyltransferase RsmD
VVLRIIAGEKRGLKLFVPQGPDIRPTSAKVREAVFSMLGEEKVRDKRVLDLYAGSGAMGLEAKSRGASSVLFCDMSKDALKVLSKNLSLFPKGSDLRILEAYFPGDYELLKSYGPFDLFFLDPPYLELIEPLNFLKATMEMNIAANEASLVWETSKRNLNAVVQGDFSPWTMAKSRSLGNKGALIFEL